MGTHPIFESDFDCLTAMVQRLTFRRTLSYNTSSNRKKIVKTPGGKLVYQHISKAAKAPKCGDTGVALKFPVARHRTLVLLCGLLFFDQEKILLFLSKLKF